MLLALIPAAGRSSRMGRPKLALPLGDRSVLERVVGAVRQAGVDRVLVVVGAHVPELVALAQSAGAGTLLLRERTADMRATVEHGLRALEEHFHPRPDDSLLLLPADHPTVDAGVIQELLQAAAAHANRSIFIPVHGDKRGHPALIRWKHVQGIQELPAGLGLNIYFRQHTHETFEVPTSNSACLCDLDTPGDYERLKSIFSHGSNTDETRKST
jgi:molybdenum cofactor cytidylyltransferase